jgi:BirA family biotin operon repressor/biotin-[acetyl-CoA-carboxylase] ligase
MRCEIKWPNDVWVDGRKLAGVLVEARPQDGWAVIGVGLNLTVAEEEFPPELRETAASLFGAGGEETADAAPREPPAALRERARRALDDALGRWVEAEPAAVLAEWRARDALRGREVAWGEGSGVAEGIDDTGRLIVATPGGEPLALGAGEVHLRL